MNKDELQTIIDKMKEPLQEYWTNKIKLPMHMQLHSMALMDMFIHDLSENPKSEAERMLDHYFRRELITHIFYKNGLRNLWLKEINPFTQTLQKVICFKALKRKYSLSHELIDKVYKDITLLFNSESRDDGKGEKLDEVYFNNLIEICSIPNYTIDIYRPLIYKIRKEIEDQNKGNWSLKEIISRIIKYLKEEELRIEN